MSEPDFLSRREALGEGHPSQLEIDRARLEEPGTESTRAHLDGCEECKARVAKLEGQDSGYLASTFIAKEAQAVKKRAGGAPPRRLWAAGVGIAAAAGLAALMISPLLKAPAGERVKGNEPELVVYRSREGKVVKVNEGDTFKAGDALRFEVVIPRAAHVVILGVDGTGTVTPYSPPAGAATALTAGRHTLPHAVKLDAVAGHERVMAFICDGPFSVDEARAAASVEPIARPNCVVRQRQFTKN